MTKDLSDRDKLRVLLPHWLEHNKSHGEEFGRWVELLRQSGEEDVAALLFKAVQELQNADRTLAEVLNLLGGSLADSHHDHHHHHD